MSRRVHNEARRIPLDAYYTEDATALACVRTLDLLDEGLTVIEPSVGGGAFVRAVIEVAPSSYVIGVDVNPDAAGTALCQYALDCDFAITTGHAHWIIGNPPYSHAEAHVRHALTLAPRCAFLLRLAFLESVKRVDFWRDHQPSEVFVLAKRPSFTGGGTDSAAYGWFVWDRTKPGPTRMSILTPDGPLWETT